MADDDPKLEPKQTRCPSCWSVLFEVVKETKWFGRDHLRCECRHCGTTFSVVRPRPKPERPPPRFEFARQAVCTQCGKRARVSATRGDKRYIVCTSATCRARTVELGRPKR